MWETERVGRTTIRGEGGEKAKMEQRYCYTFGRSSMSRVLPPIHFISIRFTLDVDAMR
jgi:hypothetical protein